MSQPFMDGVQVDLLELTPDAVIPRFREALTEIGVAFNVVATSFLSTSGDVPFKAGFTLLAGVRLIDVAADEGGVSSGSSLAGYSRRTPRYRGDSRRRTVVGGEFLARSLVHLKTGINADCNQGRYPEGHWPRSRDSLGIPRDECISADRGHLWILEEVLKLPDAAMEVPFLLRRMP